MIHHWICGYSMYSQTNFSSSGYMIVCPQTNSLLTAGWSQPSQWCFAQGQRIWVTGLSTEIWTHQSVCLWLPKTTEIVWVLHLDPAQKSEIWQTWRVCREVMMCFGFFVVQWWQKHRSFEQPESDDKFTGPGGHSIGAQVGLEACRHSSASIQGLSPSFVLTLRPSILLPENHRRFRPERDREVPKLKLNHINHISFRMWIGPWVIILSKNDWFFWPTWLFSIL